MKTISEYLRRPFDHALLKEVGTFADAIGIRAFAVGGFVRDLILGREVKDIDILVVGKGTEFARGVAKKLGIGNVSTYENFGTAMMEYGGMTVEFVGARKESYDKSSRKPVVENGTLEDDLARRDFTINTLAFSLNSDRYGELIDKFNGLRDLNEKLIRTPLDPARTFDDDPLRIMRAMRFASQLNFTLDPSLFEAASSMAERLRIVSAERVADEFLKIMASPKPSIGLWLMYESGVMKVVFPEVAEMAGVEQRFEYHHKDVLYHTLQVVDTISFVTENVWLRAAALLHDIAKPRTKAFKEGIGWTFHGHEEIGARMIKGIFRRMRFPLDQAKYVEKLVRLHLRPQALAEEGVTDSAVRRLMFEAGEEIDDLMHLCRSDITSKNPKLVKRILQNYEQLEKRIAEVEEKDKMRAWQPPVRGDEIIELFSLEPGRMVGVLKKALTDAVLDGVIPNEREAAIGFLKEYYRKIEAEGDTPPNQK